MLVSSRATLLLFIAGVLLVVIGFSGKLAGVLAAIFAPDRVATIYTTPAGGTGGGSFG